ncbi:MAG: right-handed parallel beta-helix repeat-containing protein [Planctomycetota bacterium]
MRHHLPLALALAAPILLAQTPDTGPADAAPTTTTITLGSQRFGASADELGPIGGGPGYQRIGRDGVHTARNLEQLLAALAAAKAGETVHLPGDVEIDCTGPVHIDRLVLEVPAGVTLASDRGANGSPGALLRSDTLATQPLLRTLGPGVRITGLRLQGPDRERRLEHWQRAYRGGRGKPYYYQLPVADGVLSTHGNLEVDNCELSGWSHAAVLLQDGTGHRIHHCHVHHCQRQGLGYGVCLDVAEARIDHNLFDWNRHSIAATGRPGTGYEAHDNVELGVSLSHCFDMHGGRDRKDGTDIAGSWFRIHHNTFLGDARAIAIRGVPERESRIEGNWFQRQADAEHAVRGGGEPTQIGANAYGREHPDVSDGR